MSRSRTALAALAGLALVLTAACGGGGRDEALPTAGAPVPTPSSAARTTAVPTTTTPAPTTSAAPIVDQKVVDLGASVLTLTYPADLDPSLRPAIDQYLRFQTAVIRGGTQPDPTDPDITESTTASAGEALRSRVANRIVTGERGNGSGFLNPQIVESTASLIKIEDCVLDGFNAIDGRGQVISPASTTRKIYYAELVNIDDTWRVDTSYPTGQACEL